MHHMHVQSVLITLAYVTMSNDTQSTVMISVMLGLFMIVFLNLWAIERDKSMLRQWNIEMAR